MSTRFFLVSLSMLMFGCAAEPVTDDVAVVPGGKADGASVPWGGTDPSRWSPEAVIANAVSAELRNDPMARVSVPAGLLASTYSPFGDGQTNAAASLGSWQARRPPVVATRNANGRLTVRFDRELPFAGDTFELWTPNGTWLRSVASTRTSAGDWIITVDDLPDALRDRLVVSPRGWADGFPLAFDMPITTVAALEQQLPATMRTLPGGEPVVDPVSARLASQGTTAFDILMQSSFPQAFVNQQPFSTDEVHAAFPQNGAPRVTAVGGAATWLAEQPFKNMYVCFAKRNVAAETTHGVPSGAGWHRIGAASESLLASVERGPLLIGHARDVRWTPPANGQFAYGLDRATTYALLRPDHAFTTAQNDFHWYAIDQAFNPCVQIWVSA